MGSLDNRVVIVTGAGRGLGREHALLLASEGASVVVNDLSAPGSDGSITVAEEVALEIRSAGGKACHNTDDITTADGAAGLLASALDEFGDVHALVNNAGILRDHTLLKMTDEEFDDVNRVHMRGHFCPTRAVAQYWRDHTDADSPVRRAVVNTTSGAGLYGNVGQTNYAGAKAAIAAYTQVWAKELSRYGIGVNAISPLARTRLTTTSAQVGELMAAKAGSFDFYNPANASPLVAYLVSDGCAFNGHVFYVQGDQVTLMTGWGANLAVYSDDGRWTTAELAKKLDGLDQESAVGDWGTIQDHRAGI
jgi:NAD(P)-dependent dehydrogenase (short-subunit alcohol dehydrogenase family)